jgi:ATP-dependent helicase/nuclease subunit A
VAGHIAVLDLLALIDVLLNPAEDLQLGALLRSPLFDVSEEELLALAHGRGGKTLWQALFDAPQPFARAAAEQLGRWQAGLDRERPFEFLAGVLYEGGGLRRFHARMGAEIDEVLSELLDLALLHEQGEQPSLQGFAAEMRRRTVTIKRELAESGGGVRVMTVHGAKGLEAPIVILADATAKPSAQMTGKPVYLLTEAPGPMLIHASSRALHTPQTIAIKDQADATLNEEYWRRLYVGMTRAEDELYLTGPLAAVQRAETQLAGSWYEAVETALGPDLHPVLAGGEVGARVFNPTQRAASAGTPAATAAPMPPLALEPVPAPPVVPLVSPSRAGVETAPRRLLQSVAEEVRDAEAARKEGLALHALLQHLGRVERRQWETVAPRALETLLPHAPERHASVARKAIAILDRLDFSHLFGPESRAEVPFLFDLRQAGRPVRVSGRIDRLVVDDSTVLVVDYKSDAKAARSVAEVPGNYLTQVGLYALVATQLFPGRTVQGAILWTELELLMNLPSQVLEAARADFTLR